MNRHLHTIAIVGGGFSGTVLAANLLRRPPSRATRIVLIERNAEIGGVAYATRAYPYLLNVPAGRMSADSRSPGAFLDFVRLRQPSASAEDFLPRAWYGEYLQAMLGNAIKLAPRRVSFERLQDEVAGVAPSAGNDGLRITFRDGRTLIADDVVLACGNPPPTQLAGLAPVLDHPRYVSDACRGGPPDGYRGEVLMIGTGLTMADATQYATDRSDVVVHAISRHGLVPPSQTAFTHTAGMTDAAALADAHTVRQLLRAARTLARDAERVGADWRDLVTTIREHAPAIWRRLDADERARFLRHLRPYWDVHRHRLPPTTFQRLSLLREQGRLRVHAGRILDAQPVDGRLAVTWRARGEARPQRLTVDWIVNCTGPDYDLRRTANTLFLSLGRAGLAVPDEFGLGLKTGLHGALVNRSGGASAGLYCLGPMLRGDHWETTAVAELRAHAEALAEHLAGVEPSWLPAARHVDEWAEAEPQPA